MKLEEGNEYEDVLVENLMIFEECYPAAVSIGYIHMSNCMLSDKFINWNRYGTILISI
jgi:hypothetical protein